MYIRALSILCILIALHYAIAVATEVYVDDFIKPKSLALYLLFSTMIAGSAIMIISTNNLR